MTGEGFVYLSTCASVCLFVCLSVCLCVSTDVSLCTSMAHSTLFALKTLYRSMEESVSCSAFLHIHLILSRLGIVITE